MKLKGIMMKVLVIIREIKKDVWRDYVENDVFFTAFSYARYSKMIQEITRFGRKVCLSLPGLGWKCFSSLRTEEIEPIDSYKDKYMHSFVRQSFERRRVAPFNQYFKPKFCDDLF